MIGSQRYQMMCWAIRMMILDLSVHSSIFCILELCIPVRCSKNSCSNAKFQAIFCAKTFTIVVVIVDRWKPKEWSQRSDASNRKILGRRGGFFPLHNASMGLVYLPTWKPRKINQNVGKYTSPMDAMGNNNINLRNRNLRLEWGFVNSLCCSFSVLVFLSTRTLVAIFETILPTFTLQ